MGAHLHPERERSLGERTSDTPEPDDAEPHVADAAKRACRVVVPSPGADAAIELDDTTRQGEEQRECVVGHLVDAVVRHVADPHATRRRGVDVDVVEADARRRDHAEIGEALDVVGRHRLERQQSDDVVARPRR